MTPDPRPVALALRGLTKRYERPAVDAGLDEELKD